jgi:hypothetical protein
MAELFRGFYKTQKGRHTITICGQPVAGEWLYWDEIGRFKSLSGDFVTALQADEDESDRITTSIYDNLVPETITQAVAELRDIQGWPVFTGDLVVDNRTGFVYSVIFSDFGYMLKTGGCTASIKKFDWSAKMKIVGVKWSYDCEF